MDRNLSASAQRVQIALQERGFSNQVVEMPQSTRSAGEAAEAIGCTVAQIAKSLVFRGKESGRAVLVIASGSNRVNEKRLGELLEEPVERPNANFVLAQTGFSIGGVPPIGHERRLETFIDEDLLRYPEIWAAAGSPVAVFKLTPEELVRMTAGRVVGIKQ